MEGISTKTPANANATTTAHAKNLEPISLIILIVPAHAQEVSSVLKEKFSMKTLVSVNVLFNKCVTQTNIMTRKAVSVSAKMYFTVQKALYGILNYVNVSVKDALLKIATLQRLGGTKKPANVNAKKKYALLILG